MDSNIINLIEEKILSHEHYPKWSKKDKSFFNGFYFLNHQDLIEKQMDQLTHVGINSLQSSTQLIHELTSQNIDLIENVLKKVTDDMSSAIDLLENTEKALKKKGTFFNKKNTSEQFLEFFQAQYPQLKDYLNNLLVKQKQINEHQKNLNENIDKLIEQMVFLKKDELLLKRAKEEFKNHLNEDIVNAYEKIEFDLNSLQMDLLTQQTVVYQKYCAMNILKNNMENCQRNINYINRTSSSALLNVAETHQIIQLSSDKDMIESMELLKNTFGELSNHIKTFIKSPFAALTNFAVEPSRNKP